MDVEKACRLDSDHSLPYEWYHKKTPCSRRLLERATDT
jgi:hypothetical protein